MSDDTIQTLTKVALYFCRKFEITKKDVDEFKRNYKSYTSLKKQYGDYQFDRKEGTYNVYRCGDIYVDAKKFDQFFMLLDPDVRNKVYLNLNSSEITDGCFYYTEFSIEEVDDLC